MSRKDSYFHSGTRLGNFKVTAHFKASQKKSSNLKTVKWLSIIHND
jgi:hypothetical protein